MIAGRKRKKFKMQAAAPPDQTEDPDRLNAIKRERGLRVSLVLAQSINGVIGADGKLPWHFPEDLQSFKATTLGGTLVMGRRTWESIGRPLPGRTNLVISSRRREELALPEEVLAAASLAEALEIAPADRVFHVVGGAALFAGYLPAADVCYVTLIKDYYAGDVSFPALYQLDPAAWRIAERRPLSEAAELFVAERRV